MYFSCGLIFSQGVFPVRSVGSPVSAGSLKNCSMKASLDCQPSVLRLEESLSPASLDSIVVAERDTKSEKYTSASPMNSPECLGTDQVLCLPMLIFFCYCGLVDNTY